MVSNEHADETAANPTVLAAYRTAGRLASEALIFAMKKCTDGVKVADVCEATNEFIKKSCGPDQGIAFPTCLNINNILCHFAPIKDDEEGEDPKLMTMRTGDLVKIELGVQSGGYPTLLAHSLVIGAKTDDPLLTAARKVLQAHLQEFKAGADSLDIAKRINQLASEIESAKLFEGVMSHSMERNNLSGATNILVIPGDATVQRFALKEYEVIALDVAITNGDGKMKQLPLKTTIFRRTSTQHELKLKASRSLLNEVRPFGQMAFNISQLTAPKKSRLGLPECIKTGLLEPYAILGDRSDTARTARISITVVLLPDGKVEELTSIPKQ